MEAFLKEYAKAIVAGIAAYAVVFGAFKFWLHLDPAKGWGVVTLVAFYAGYAAFKKVAK